MGRFVKKVNLDPREIRYMSLADKQECMAEIDRRRRIAWLYSLFFCGGILLYLMVYSIASTMYTLSVMKLLPAPGTLLFFVPFIVFVPSFFAHSMHGGSIVVTAVAYMLAGFYVIVTGSFVNAWTAPFAFAGAVVYFILSRTCDMYYALEKEEGFPEFCDIKCMSDSAREIIERNKKEEEPPLHIMTETAILAQKMKSDAAEQKKAEDTSAEKADNIPSETAEDNIPAENAEDNTSAIKSDEKKPADNNIPSEKAGENKKRSRKKRKRGN
ncbi:MAG: hypothetical protein ACI4JF_01735 [Oscillospiraceae bacterium]